ncbi:MAG: hypothetical protein AAF585_10385, partial [Verrucomicrobiota bacterium]
MIQFIIKDADGNIVSQGDIANTPTAQPGPNQTVEFVDENGQPVQVQSLIPRQPGHLIVTFADGSALTVENALTGNVALVDPFGTGSNVNGQTMFMDLVIQGGLNFGSFGAGSQLAFQYADSNGGISVDAIGFDEVVLIRLGSGSLPTSTASQTSGQLLDQINAQLTAAGLQTGSTVGEALETFVQQFDPALVQAVNAALDFQPAIEVIDTSTTSPNAPQNLTEVVEVLETVAQIDIPVGEPAAPAFDPLNPTEDDAAFS